MAKIADSLVFVLDSTEGWDSYGDYCLSGLFAQGLPSHGGYKPEHTAGASLAVTLLLQQIVCIMSDFYGVHFLSAYLSVPKFTPCSTGVSGLV